MKTNEMKSEKKEFLLLLLMIVIALTGAFMDFFGGYESLHGWVITNFVMSYVGAGLMIVIFSFGMVVIGLIIYRGKEQ